MVRADDLFKLHGQSNFKNTPQLKFVVLNRGDVTGIGLDNGRYTTDIFLVHRLMEIDDLSLDKLHELIEKLNICLVDAREAKLW